MDMRYLFFKYIRKFLLSSSHETESVLLWSRKEVSTTLSARRIFLYHFLGSVRLQHILSNVCPFNYTSGNHGALYGDTESIKSCAPVLLTAESFLHGVNGNLAGGSMGLTLS